MQIFVIRVLQHLQIVSADRRVADTLKENQISVAIEDGDQIHAQHLQSIVSDGRTNVVRAVGLDEIVGRIPLRVVARHHLKIVLLIVKSVTQMLDCLLSGLALQAGESPGERKAREQVYRGQKAAQRKS